MATHASGRGWSATEAQATTFVELFFDLVFVFAVTSITGFLVHHLTWGGLGRGVLILWLVWWAWTQFTWTLNPADTNHPAVRLITLAATAAAFFMAQAIPDAFTSTGAWFAVAYVIVRVLGLGLQAGLSGMTEDQSRTFVVWMMGSSAGLVLVLAGGLLATPWREILWTGAVLADWLSAARAGRGRWHLYPEHFAERHGLIVIIALGESLIASGLALKDTPRDTSFAVGTVSAVVSVCALWWIYFGLAKDRMEHYLGSRTAEQAGGEARNIYSWGHLPIIGGIIAFAVALERILTHAHDPLGPEAAAALVLGVCLYLGGIAYGLRRSGHPATARAAATAMTTAGVVAVAWIRAASGLAALLAVAAILAGAALWEARSQRRR